MNPKIICLTPVKNEAWILDRFLKATSLWADYIIIADQMSTDGSREIAKKYSKVILIDNTSEAFNEPERQKLLIEEARKIKGRRLLITLDVDEFFTPNILDSEDWQKIINSPIGTAFRFQRADFHWDKKHMWITDFYFPWGLMDDNSQYASENLIHCSRITQYDINKEVFIHNIIVLHLQYIYFKRMQSKHRWYQCLEKITNPKKNSLEIFREYNHMHSVSQKNLNLIPQMWINNYKDKGIDLLINPNEEKIWFDQKVLDLFDRYGTVTFRQIAIWDINWIKIGKTYNKKQTKKYKDPRSLIDKLIQKWLQVTQPFEQQNIFIRRVDRLIVKKIFKY